MKTASVYDGCLLMAGDLKGCTRDEMLVYVDKISWWGEFEKLCMIKNIDSCVVSRLTKLCVTESKKTFVNVLTVFDLEKTMYLDFVVNKVGDRFYVSEICRESLMGEIDEENEDYGLFSVGADTAVFVNKRILETTVLAHLAEEKADRAARVQSAVKNKSAKIISFK